MEPELEKVRRKAPYRLRMTVEEVRLIERSPGGGTHCCEATGTVLEVGRKSRPWLRRDVAGAPVPGVRLTVRIRCWPCGGRDEPPGPRRIYFQPGHRPGGLEVWGEVQEGRFVVHDFDPLVPD